MMAAAMMLCRSARRLSINRSGLLLRGIRNASGSASAGMGSTNIILFAAGFGVLGVTSYAILSRNKSDVKLGFNSKLEATRVKEYTKTGDSSHPEAEAEKLIATEAIPDTPPVKPIVSTEVVAEALPTKTNTTNLELPSHVTYILVGAGTASFAAAKAIRESDPKAKVLIIGEEESPPYSRPPLSKQLWLYEDHDATKQLKFKAAWSGKSRGLKITQVFPEEGNLGLVLPTSLCKWTTDKVRQEGVTVLPGTTVSKVTLSEEKKVMATLSDGSELTADHVVVAVGLQPNTDLASSAGLETDPTLGGYRVNAELQACTDVWVAGDVSCFFDPKLGRRRVEHHDHANVSGRLAGENMAGSHRRFDHQSMFWSDLGSEVGFEATGLIDGKLPTVGVWAKMSDEGMPVDDFSKGVVFYLSQERGGRVLGVLTWNLFGKMGVAKQMIADEKHESDISELIGKFELHKTDENKS